MASQSVTEYGSTVVKDVFQWTSHAAQEHWHYLVAGAVLIVVVGWWVRK